MGFNFGFGGFGGFGVLFGIMSVLILGVFIFALVKGAGRWHKNNQSPRLTVGAVVVALRTDVSHHHHNNGGGAMHTTTSTTYYATFEFESGDRLELTLSGPEYGRLAEGDSGYLTFQGARYLDFQRA